MGKTKDAPAALGGSAAFSTDGLYRFSLSRTVVPSVLAPLRLDDGARSATTVLFCCLNPSTATAAISDPTVRKLEGFAARWGFSQLWLGNLFAYRATDPKDLTAAHASGVDVTGGEDNYRVLMEMADASAGVIVAWGAGPKNSDGGSGGWFNDQAECVVRRCFPGRPLYCLGTTQSGMPRHPLYLPYAETRPVAWTLPLRHAKTRRRRVT